MGRWCRPRCSLSNSPLWGASSSHARFFSSALVRKTFSESWKLRKLCACARDRGTARERFWRAGKPRLRRMHHRPGEHRKGSALACGPRHALQHASQPRFARGDLRHSGHKGHSGLGAGLGAQGLSLRSVSAESEVWADEKISEFVMCMVAAPPQLDSSGGKKCPHS